MAGRRLWIFWNGCTRTHVRTDVVGEGLDLVDAAAVGDEQQRDHRLLDAVGLLHGFFLAVAAADIDRRRLRDAAEAIGQDPAQHEPIYREELRGRSERCKA